MKTIFVSVIVNLFLVMDVTEARELLISILLCLNQIGAIDPVAPIRGFIQTNFVGLPVIHDQQAWEFDPDISLKRRKQFISLHGDKGEWLIERLGLGIDGNEERRLMRQRIRDEGHLGGLNYLSP